MAEPHRLYFSGLENAGTTTLLCRLEHKYHSEEPPVKIEFIDGSGGRRELWRENIQGTDLFIFAVDTKDAMTAKDLLAHADAILREAPPTARALFVATKVEAEEAVPANVLTVTMTLDLELAPDLDCVKDAFKRAGDLVPFSDFRTFEDPDYGLQLLDSIVELLQKSNNKKKSSSVSSGGGSKRPLKCGSWGKLVGAK